MIGRLESRILRGTTESDQTLTVDDIDSIAGQLYAVQWIDGAFTDGVDAVISVQNTQSGVALTFLTLTNANVDKWYFPREVVHDNAGGALTGTSGGDRTAPMIDGTLRMAVTAGGATKEGGCIVYVVVN